ncbi:MAG TPA: hypothetical protein VHC43_13990 [Mycobacteriales bacterium]|nr:hypothetical protein [Mycobacteriales bacterium]
MPAGRRRTDGTTAEWISERNTVGGTPANLREWKIWSTGPNQSEWNTNGAEVVDGADTSTGTLAQATGTRAYSLTMNDGSQNIATNSFTQGAQVWDDTWKHCN